MSRVTLAAIANDLQARCGGDRSTIADEEIERFLSAVGVMVEDTDHGHSVVRSATVEALLRPGGSP